MKIVFLSWISCLGVIYDVRHSPYLSPMPLGSSSSHSSLGPVRFFTRGDRQVLYSRTFFCCLFLARQTHYASVRYILCDFLLSIYFGTSSSTPTETSSRIIFFLMSAATLTLPTLILPSISLSGAYLLAWLDPWLIWLLKFFTNAATLTPLIGGHLVFVHMNFFLGADRSEAARIPHSHKAFPETNCDFPRMQEKNVVPQESTSLLQCVFPFYLHLSSLELLPLQLLDRDPYKRIACSPQGDSLDEIHRHPWFSSLDWAALDRKEIPSPFVPDVSFIR